MNTKVKICGLRQLAEIQLAAQLGVNAIGFVLYPHSKRALTLEQAVALRSFVPASLQLVALLVNPSENEVSDVITKLSPDVIQFHGDEEGGFCEQFNYPYWRAVRVGAKGLETTEGLQRYINQYPHAQRFLFDAYSSSYGGAGIRFDLALLKGLREPVLASMVSTSPLIQKPPLLASSKIVIAGGIHEGNVEELLGKYDFIDLSSGVEDKPGIKSLEKMMTFMQKVRN